MFAAPLRAQAALATIAPADRMAVAVHLVAEANDPDLCGPLLQLADLARRQADDLSARRIAELMYPEETIMETQPLTAFGRLEQSWLGDLIGVTCLFGTFWGLLFLSLLWGGAQ